ncbi:MAG: TolC family protein, partial [Gemmatimonadota bacterium]
KAPKMTHGRRSLDARLALAAGGALFLVAGLLPAPSAGQELDVTEGAARSVTVDEAVRAALRNSPDLRQARAGVREARTQETGAVGAFLPNLDLSYGFSDASTGRLDPTSQAITTTSFDTQLTGSVQILDGLRRFNQLDNAEKEVTAQRATFEQRRYELMLETKRAFFDAVAARERVRVEEDRVERQREQLDFVRQQISLGQATRADSLSSRVNLNDARLALLNARNDARAAQFALAEAMGVMRRVAPAEEAALEPDTLDLDLDRLMTMAEERAPRVRSARRSAEAAESSVDSEKSGFAPSLQLSGGWAWQNDDFPPKDRSWSFSLRGSLPLFDGFQRETGVAAAEARADAADARVRSEVLAVRSEVDDAHSQMETALAGLDVARESVELSRENLRVARQRYRLGANTILELQQAQIDLQQAELDLIQRQFDYQVAVARLESLLGTELDAGAGPATGAGSPTPSDSDTGTDS